MPESSLQKMFKVTSDDVSFINFISSDYFLKNKSSIKIVCTLGLTGVGKSSVCNTLTRTKHFTTSAGLKSYTPYIEGLLVKV